MDRIIYGKNIRTKKLTLTIKYPGGSPIVDSETSDGFTKEDLELVIGYFQHYIEEYSEVEKK